VHFALPTDGAFLSVFWRTIPEVPDPARKLSNAEHKITTATQKAD
jgi:hypothetical protein